MKLDFERENLKYDKLVEIINSFEYPIILLKGMEVDNYNQKAKELFGFNRVKKTMNIFDISSKYEKNTFYQDFIEENIYIGSSGSKRFKWIHKDTNERYFMSEVVLLSVNVGKDVYTVSMINDMSLWVRNKRVLEEQHEIDFSVLCNNKFPMMIIDPKSGNIENFNDAAVFFYGYGHEELKKMNISEINIMDDEFIKSVMKSAKMEIRGHFILEHRKKNGEIVEVDVFTGPVEINKRTRLYSIIAPVDDGGDKHVIDDFEKVKEMYLKLPFATVVLDSGMKISQANDEFFDLFSYEEHEVSNGKLSNLICPVEFLEEFRFYERMLRLGEKIVQEVRRKNKGGRLLYLKKYASMFLDKNGEYNYMVSYVDNEKNYRVKERLSIIDNFFKIVEEGVMITDKDAKIVWANEAFSNITGYSLNEIIYKDASILKSHLHDKEFYEEMMNKVFMNGSWEGEVYNRKSNGEIYSVWLRLFQIENLNGEFKYLGGVLKDLAGKKSQDEKIRYYAYKDILTGLDNRIHIIDSLNALVNGAKMDESIGVILFDLDDFKSINDSLGHAFGDKLLIEFANRLKDIFKNENMIARIGGDEFFVILKNINEEEINNVISKAMDIIADPFIVDGHIYELNTSAGILMYPKDATKVQDILKRVGMAVSYSKRTKGNSFTFFRKEIEEEFNEKYLIDKYLLRAVQNKELELVYQGIKNIRTGMIDSAEVLLRWNNKHLGFVSPARFIPIAEKNLSIISIGRWVIEQVCKNIKRYEKDMNLSKIAINISVTQLEYPEFFTDVKSIIERYNVKKDVLEFEITESVYMKNMHLITENLRKLYDYGISISMDDFGTGYSSLSQIRRLKLSKIKIDKEFITAMENSSVDTQIVSAIVALAKGMNLSITAEGIEQSSQYKLLEKLGCDYAQGYHIHKPSNIESLKEFLKDNKK